MLPVLKIIHLLWIRKFYERHAGLLFFVFYVMFGMVESGQIVSYHLGLIYGALSSFVFMVLVLAIWFLYLVKGILLFEECLFQPKNIFFREIGLLDRKIQFLLISYAIVLIYLPVLLYSAFMMAIAIQTQNLMAFFGIISFHVVIICLSAWRITYTINSSMPSLLQIPSFHLPFVKPFPLFYIGLLTDRFKITLLLTKIFSILCIIGFLQIPLDNYDPRLAYLGLIIGIISHTVIIFEWRKFEDQYLVFTRALPIALPHRFALTALAYAILLLPEFIVLLTQNIYPPHALLGLFLGVSFSLFAHCSLYKKELDNDRHLQTVLWLFLITFFLALSKLALPTAILLCAWAWWRFMKNFQKYEAAANISV
jgi:hypothetical protein